MDIWKSKMLINPSGWSTLNCSVYLGPLITGLIKGELSYNPLLLHCDSHTLVYCKWVYARMRFCFITDMLPPPGCIKTLWVSPWKIQKGHMKLGNIRNNLNKIICEPNKISCLCSDTHLHTFNKQDSSLWNVYFYCLGRIQYNLSLVSMLLLSCLFLDHRTGLLV